MDDTDAARRTIQRQAEARAEATVYALNNPYLTIKQKAHIEGVYQFPSCVMDYSFAVFAAVLAEPFWHAWSVATVLSIGGWIAARFLPWKLIAPIGMALGGWTSTIICLAAAIWAAIHGHYPSALYLSLAAFGITSFVEVVTWLWTFTSRRMNAKYRIAKRMYGVTFPFESELG